MKKRVISFLLTVNFLFVFIIGKLYYIANTSNEVSIKSSLRAQTIDEKRGFIYDRNLSPIVNEKTSYTLLIKPTASSYSLISKLTNDENPLNNLKKGNLAVIDFNNIPKIDNKDIKVLKKYERYGSENLLHIIGYLDESNNGVYGIEKYFNDDLLKMGGNLKISYSTNAFGQLLTGENIEIKNNNYYSQEGIVLTIDLNIQKIVEEALKNNNITKGAAIVLDVNSNEILAAASTPTFKRSNIYASTKNSDLPFLNRAFSAFPVGSIFKIVTSAAAFENKIALNNFNCTGSITKSGNTFYCSKLDGHKKIDFNEALSKSCNPYFIELGAMVGNEKLLNEAKILGFGKSTDFGNGYCTDKGTLPTLKDLNSTAAIGNFAFGQGKLSATPLQICQLFSTVGNGGLLFYPTLIKGKVNSRGGYCPVIKEKGQRVLKKETCKKINSALILTTKTGTGKSAFTSLFDSATKTATAQSGRYNEDGTEIKYCWFGGYFPAEKPKYAICILKENGISGGSDGGPVFKEISENIYIYDKINQSKESTFSAAS